MNRLDELVPEPLHTWEAAGVLDRLRARGAMETIFFEFKRIFNGTDVEKNVSAFANNLGGFLRISLNSPLQFAGIRHPVSRVFAAFSEAAPAADAGRQFIP